MRGQWAAAEVRFRRGGGGWRQVPRGWPGGEPAVDASDAAGWFTGRVPAEWFDRPLDVTVDRDEILVAGTLSVPAVDGDAATVAAAEAGTIKRFREDTREARIGIAREAEGRYGRRVSWGAVAGDTRETFTTLSAPVMTRLRQPERSVLDTLVDAGVARSRSEALAWCVKLVGKHEGDWIAGLRDALVAVEQAREGGPTVD